MLMENAATRLYFQEKFETAQMLLLDVYRMKYETLIKDRTFKYVKRVNFEITSICNLKCKYCTFESGKRKKTIDLNLFEKILKDIAGCHPRLLTLALYMSGESLLHPQFVQILKIIRNVQKKSEDFSPEVYLHTNGTLWTPEKTDEIMETGVLNRVVWSIDGIDRESFEDMRGVTGIYDKVLDNFEYFLNHRQPGLKAWVNNLREAAYLEKECTDARLESLFQKADEVQIQLPRDLNQANLTSNAYEGKSNSFCDYIFHTVVVTTDGQMSLCCTDYNSENAFGDLKNNSFSEVYYSQERMNILKNMNMGKRRRMKGCRSCTLLHGAWFQGTENCVFLKDSSEYQKKKGFQKFWKRLIKQYGPKELVIYGAGKHTHSLLNAVRNLDHTIIGGVIDNYKSPYSCLFGHKPVFPKNLKNVSPKAILVFSEYTKKERSNSLRELFGPSIEIINFHEALDSPKEFYYGKK
jgi:radical SAM protein with 4Fe4S-binding SPASM domain